MAHNQMPLRPADGVTVYLDTTLDHPEVVLQVTSSGGRAYLADPADVESVAEALMELAREQRKELLIAEAGEALGYCEDCGDPIYEGDDQECYAPNVVSQMGADDGVMMHGRCMYASGSLAPAGYWRTDDLAGRLRALGVDPRTVGRKPDQVADIPKLGPIAAELRELDPEAWK